MKKKKVLTRNGAKLVNGTIRPGSEIVLMRGRIFVVHPEEFPKEIVNYELKEIKINEQFL